MQWNGQSKLFLAQLFTKLADNKFNVASHIVMSVSWLSKNKFERIKLKLAKTIKSETLSPEQLDGCCRAVVAIKKYTDGEREFEL